MGLNWAAGLAGAASGMEGLVDLKQKEVGMLYDQVSQQNQFRHREQMQSNQQEFLTGEREAGQQWKLENEIPLKQKEIEQRGELAILQQESLDTQRAIENQLRQQANDIQQQRANTTAAGQESETAMDRERLLAEQKKFVDERWEGWDDSYQSRMLKKNDPEGYKAKLAEKEDDYALASLLPSQQSHYIDAQKGMVGLNATARREIGKTYATMSPEQRDQVWNSLPKGASGRQFGEAVRAVKSGKIPEPSSKVDTSGTQGESVNPPTAEGAAQERMGPVTEEERKAALFGGDRESRQVAQADIMKRQGEWKRKVEERAREIARRSGIDLNSISQKDQIYSRNKTDSKTYDQLVAQAEAELKRENDDFIQSPQLAQK